MQGPRRRLFAAFPGGAPPTETGWKARHSGGSVNALTVTPRQPFEASRLADRIGPAYMAELDGARVLMLLATRGSEPDLAPELDAAGNGIARRFRDLAHRDDGEDDLSDLSDERPLPDPIDISKARPAPRCECLVPRRHDGFTCGICGWTLSGDAPEAAEAA
jgi:hypothetical protein